MTLFNTLIHYNRVCAQNFNSNMTNDIFFSLLAILINKQKSNDNRIDLLIRIGQGF